MINTFINKLIPKLMEIIECSSTWMRFKMGKLCFFSVSLGDFCRFWQYLWFQSFRWFPFYYKNCVCWFNNFENAFQIAPSVRHFGSLILWIRWWRGFISLSLSKWLNLLTFKISKWTQCFHYSDFRLNMEKLMSFSCDWVEN